MLAAIFLENSYSSIFFFRIFPKISKFQPVNYSQLNQKLEVEPKWNYRMQDEHHLRTNPERITGSDFHQRINYIRQ